MNQIPAFLQNDSEVYFAALNSSAGFLSFFPEIFSPFEMERIVILKGGPGTGKSTMLRSLAVQARAHGVNAQCFLCSSDPLSLDAVLLPEKRICVLDGTAPHTVEAICPGAVEEIFDAGAFWDKEKLRSNKELFFAMLLQKKEQYRRGYQLLKTAGELALECRRLAVTDIDTQKLELAAARQFSHLIRTQQSGKRAHRQITAFSGRGIVKLDSFRRSADVVVRVTPAMGAGLVYLEAVRRLALQRGIGFFESTDILEPDFPEALYFPQDKVFFYVGEAGEAQPSEKTVNLLRFQSREALRAHRNRMRFLEKCKDALAEKAQHSFAEAAEIHARLEGYYVEAMDFSSLSELWRMKREELLS